MGDLALSFVERESRPKSLCGMEESLARFSRGGLNF